MKKILTLISALFFQTAVAQNCVPNTSSVLFNGTSSYVSYATDNNLLITDSLSVEAWINAAAWGLNSFNGSIVCKHSWSQGEQGFVIRAGGNGVLSFLIAGLDTNGLPTSWQEIESPVGSMTLNTWYHIAGTYDGDSLRIYINGNVVGTLGFKGTIIPQTAYPVRIGMISDPVNAPLGRYWNGKIDEVRIWHRAISQSEIQANMSNHIDPAVQTGLAGYYRFNENSGTSTADLSSSGNAGTLSTATWSTLVPFNTTPPTPTISYNLGTLTCTPPAAGYQWYFNLVTIPGATQQTYVPMQNGTYYVVVTDVNGCTASSSSIIVTGVGIDENEFQSAVLFLYGEDELTILSKNNAITFDRIEVTDISGKSFSSNNISEPTSPEASGLKLQTLNFPSGIYFVKVTAGENVIVKKIFVN